MNEEFDKYWNMIPTPEEIEAEFSPISDSEVSKAVSNSKKIGALWATRIIREKMLNLQKESHEKEIGE